ncbi:hypothetical protein NECAME_13321 [Necator americanus]|uniref:Uncharacterized protein n=1 Tax=Necator americanus TaxID=51031 RepID=W2SW06_NECAM|nr:hypothetical protein NECAME_13321 [Necator americanus]ETN73929.1 hypothetical protein NECAME_13321 [Necator americanus]
MLKEKWTLAQPLNRTGQQFPHHRRAVVELIGASAAKNELTFTASVIEDESKNYHAWQYRFMI